MPHPVSWLNEGLQRCLRDGCGYAGHRGGAVLPWTFLVMALLVGMAPRLSAQARPDREALAALSDSLRVVADTNELAAIAIDWNRGVPRGMRELREGLILLRRGELTRNQDMYDRALEKFAWATGSNTGWPYPWYGMASVYFGMKRQGFENRGVVFKDMADYTGFYLEGNAALQRAVERDASFRPAFDLLTTLMLDEDDRIQWAWRVQALERSPIPDPNVNLLLGRAYRRAGDDEAALERFDRYQANGGNGAVARLERARTLFGLGQAGAAVAAYRAGAVHPDSLGRAFYRKDLSWVSTEAELQAFDAVPDDSLGSWIARFWETRDAEAVRPPGDRLKEHLRRWNVVSRSFRVPEPWKKAWLNPPLIQEVGPCTERGPMTIDALTFSSPTRPKDLRAGEPIFDHRAVIYMRHGEPFRKVWVPGTGDSNLLRSYPMVIDGPVPTDLEGWIYHMDGVPRAYHFVYHPAVGWGTSLNTTFFPEAYFRALALADGEYNRGAAMRQQSATLTAAEVAFDEQFPGQLDAGGFDLGISQERQPWLDYFSPENNALPYRCRPTIKRMAQRIRADMTTGVTTDTYTPSFAKALPITVRIFGLPQPGQAHGGLGLVVYAVPLASLALDTIPSGDRMVSLRFRVSALDTTTRATAWLDTARTFRLPAQLDREAKLTGYLELPLAAGTYAMRASIAQADSSRGAAVQLPAITVWDRGAALRISDIVPGRRDDNLAWRYGSYPVVLNPLHTYRPSDVATLFYVVDGLVPENEYRTTISIRPWNADEDLVTFSFEETAQAEHQVVERAIGLNDLSQGRYLVTLHLLETASGRTVERQQTINLLDRIR